LLPIWIVFIGTVECNAGFARSVAHHFFSAVISNHRNLGAGILGIESHGTMSMVKSDKE
jgi:hypothetical protein